MRSTPAARPNTLTMSEATRTDRTDEYESRHRYSMLHDEPYSYLGIEKSSSPGSEVRVYLPAGVGFKSNSLYEQNSRDWVKEHVEDHQDTRKRGFVYMMSSCYLPDPAKPDHSSCSFNSDGVKQELYDQLPEGDMREWFSNFLGRGADNSFKVCLHTVTPLLNGPNIRSKK